MAHLILAGLEELNMRGIPSQSHPKTEIPKPVPHRLILVDSYTWRGLVGRLITGILGVILWLMVTNLLTGYP